MCLVYWRYVNCDRGQGFNFSSQRGEAAQTHDAAGLRLRVYRGAMNHRPGAWDSFPQC